jgi:hypothetical protein
MINHGFPRRARCEFAQENSAAGCIVFATRRSIPHAEMFDTVMIDDAGYGPEPGWGSIIPILMPEASVAIGSSLARPGYEATPVWPEMLAHVLKSDPHFDYSEVQNGKR